MKKILIAAGLILLMVTSAHTDPNLGSQEGVRILVTDSGRVPIWRHIVKYATLGIVQTPVIVQANKPFDLAFDHNGVDTDGYRLWVNGAISRNISLAQAGLVAGVGKFTGVVLAKGTYTLHATAFNSEQESDPSNSLAVASQPGKPVPPGNLRKDGGLPGGNPIY